MASRTALFSILLKNGIDPVRDVEWRLYRPTCSAPP
jgi:hypothetical protein